MQCCWTANHGYWLLTHLHADHAGGLPGMVKARAVGTRGKIVFHVFGPGGSRGGKDKDGEVAASFPSTSRFISLMFGKQGAFGYLQDFAAPVSFKTTDLFAARKSGIPPRVIVNENGLVISAIAGHHRDAPAVIYRVDYKGKSITFSGDIDPHGHADLKRMLSHISPAVDEERETVAASIRQAYQGPLQFADDGLHLPL